MEVRPPVPPFTEATARQNEQWEFDEHGLMRRREARSNDYPIAEHERRVHIDR